MSIPAQANEIQNPTLRTTQERLIVPHSYDSLLKPKIIQEQLHRQTISFSFAVIFNMAYI